MSRSHGYDNRHGRTVASDACCYGPILCILSGLKHEIATIGGTMAQNFLSGVAKNITRYRYSDRD